MVALLAVLFTAAIQLEARADGRVAAEMARQSADAAAPLSSPPSLEAWVGGDAAGSVWSLYTGVTWAPGGSIREDGWRVRLASGSGAYRTHVPIDGETIETIRMTAFAEVLAGYQVTLGALTLKAFAGANLNGHVPLPSDPSTPLRDRSIGPKVAIESWLNLGQSDWLSVDLAWSSAHQSYYSRARLGHRLTTELSIGPESAAYGNEATDLVRAGAFLRYEWDRGEVSASGGVSGDIGKSTTPYATLVYLSKF